jgi:hypothetical protein
MYIVGLSLLRDASNQETRMHHFGEEFTRSRIRGQNFEIECRNHVTGAVVKISGPVQGVLEDEGEVIDQTFVEDLGRKFAHFLKDNLTSAVFRSA